MFLNCVAVSLKIVGSVEFKQVDIFSLKLLHLLVYCPSTALPHFSSLDSISNNRLYRWTCIWNRRMTCLHRKVFRKIMEINFSHEWNVVINRKVTC